MYILTQYLCCVFLAAIITSISACGILSLSSICLAVTSAIDNERPASVLCSLVTVDSGRHVSMLKLL